MEEKLAALLARLKACGSLVVALSSGVDSLVLARAAPRSPKRASRANRRTSLSTKSCRSTSR
ncbi:MAG: hypothetical protein IJ521_03500 [Schwartzia sp.]|nr:hypothetical protein [Schwartzia sp. (in: firmicutes)]